MTAIIGNVLFCLSATIIFYFFGLKLFQKYRKAWLNPLYISSGLLILLILSSNINPNTYLQGSFIFDVLLQLAVVSLAVPLYKQWSFLRKNYKKVLLGVICGTAMGVISVSAMAHLFHLQDQLVASLIPKSVTLPVALTISNNLGGLTSTTVFIVIISALISVTIGPKLLKRFGIKSKAAKGLAMGTSAQMLGANRSLIWGEEEGAMGSVAMTTSAVFLSISVPVLSLVMNV
ncbi:putative effector of murein hydrolase [Salirhabdus euzebyi]|uniref:Putative effector of murein hydrolase n=1 Tax=Salirhabdus euzebyi TaxID=394506 RepID=A0A841Q243_9BACI|nr:LrgB family protein [Salirhabdus euzebyi]MBB6452462.1 putative effector of murein hydrolase [Salirhabdus euzebyi]